MNLPNKLLPAMMALQGILGDVTLPQLSELLVGRHQSPLVQRRRALLITSRARMVALFFAILTPLWIPVDLLIFEAPLAKALGLLRVVAAVAFAVFAVGFRPSEKLAAAHRALFGLLVVPTIFFVLTLPLLARYPVEGPFAEFIATGYAFLPFVMVAVMGVFPITAVEGVAMALPLWLLNAAVPLVGYSLAPFASPLGALWLLGLLAAIAAVAGMSQLHFMAQLVSQASHDGLTRAYTRRVGEELLDLQFSQAMRRSGPLSLVFVDLDHFKQVNDRFGHEAGDKTLREAAAALRRGLRRGDILTRWGGEEFLLVLPNTDAAGARIAANRMRDAGLGLRPDGLPQTASIGIAEWREDGCTSWGQLVERADNRMYQAKKGGRDRAVGPGDVAPSPSAVPGVSPVAAD